MQGNGEKKNPVHAAAGSDSVRRRPAVEETLVRVGL